MGRRRVTHQLPRLARLQMTLGLISLRSSAVSSILFVDVGADDFDVGVSGCDDVEHVVAHASCGAYDEYRFHVDFLWFGTVFVGCLFKPLVEFSIFIHAYRRSREF
jgi:hypothetical protein